MGDLEGQRDRLQRAVGELADDADDNTAQMASIGRQAISEAQERLATLATPAEMRDFIEQYVGPLLLKPTGEVTRKESASEESEADVKRSIAGVGFEPTTSGL